MTAVAGVGLPPRPEPDPQVLAVLVAAVHEAWPRAAVVADDPRPRAAAWRFSGRWWTRPPSLRRQRPWARG